MVDFFRNGNIPTGISIQTFLGRVAELPVSDELYLAKEIAGLHRPRLKEFVDTIFSVTQDERIVRLFFKNPGVQKKMDIAVLSDYFTSLHAMHSKGQITREVFEECAESLMGGFVNHHDESLLPLLYNIVCTTTNKLDAFEFFQSPRFDELLAQQSGLICSARGRTGQIDRSEKAFKRIELPITFEAYLKGLTARYGAGAPQTLIREFVLEDKLTPSYIEVCRRVIGDDALVQLACDHSTSKLAINSIAKLAPIFGESAFHPPGFIQALETAVISNEVPDYLLKFQKLGLDEKSLPLLADMLLSNLKKAVRFDPDRFAMSFASDVAGLANRLGRGAEALQYTLDEVRGALGAEPTDSLTAIINKGFSERRKFQSTLQTQAYSHLVNVVAKVGLNELREIAPDANGDFILECIESRSIPINKMTVMRMFPQTKGRILENDLGL